MEHVVADLARHVEGDDHLDLAAEGQVDVVAVRVERHRLAVDLHHLEVGLVEVEDVHLVGRVADDPLLDRAPLDQLVDARAVEVAVVDAEVVVRLVEDDGADVVDLHLREVAQRRRAIVLERQVDRLLDRVAFAHHGEEVLGGVAVPGGPGADLGGVQLVAAGLAELHQDVDARAGREREAVGLEHLVDRVAVGVHHPELLAAEVEVVVDVGSLRGEAQELRLARADRHVGELLVVHQPVRGPGHLDALDHLVVQPLLVVVQDAVALGDTLQLGPALELAVHDQRSRDTLHHLALRRGVAVRVVPVGAGVVVLGDAEAVGVLVADRDHREHAVAIVVGRHLQAVEVDVGVHLAVVDDGELDQVSPAHPENRPRVHAVEAVGDEGLVACLHLLLADVQRGLADAVDAADLGGLPEGRARPGGVWELESRTVDLRCGLVLDRERGRKGERDGRQRSGNQHWVASKVGGRLRDRRRR